MVLKAYPTVRQLGGDIVDLLRLVKSDDKNWGATNPSIGYVPRKGLVVAFRSSNYIIAPNGSYLPNTPDNKFHSNIWFSELTKDLKVKNLRQIDTSTVEGWNFERGPEDPKIFYRDGQMYFSCVTMEKDITPAARMAVAKVDLRKNCLTEFTKFSGIDDQRPEKNWMTPLYEPSDFFDWIYGPNATVTGELLTSWMTDNPEVSTLRGSSNLLPWGESGYIGVMHRTYAEQSRVWDQRAFGNKDSYLRNYVHYFVEFDARGMIVALSKGFQFHKPGVEFCSGIVERGTDFLISFGREDVSSHIAIMPKSVVSKSLTPVQY
jgi:hypothetical protein